MSVRLGGEEFALVLPYASPVIALNVAERIRVAFAQREFPASAGAFRGTVSGGISLLEDGMDDLDALLRAADAALYAAKRSGRNRISIGTVQRESELESSN